MPKVSFLLLLISFLTVELHAQGPSFNADTAGCKLDTIHFSNLNSTSRAYTWKVNGVIRSNSYDFSYAFPDSGNYSVRLIQDSVGVLDSSEMNIRIDLKPIARFHSSVINAAIGDTVNFYNHSKLASNYRWNFDNSAMVRTSTDTSLYNRFYNTGLKTTELIAYSNSNCSDTIEKISARIFHPTPHQNNTWSTNFSGENTSIYEHDEGEVIKVSHDGDLIVGGRFSNATFKSPVGLSSYDPGSGFYIAKYNKEGALKWIVKGIDTIPGSGITNTSFRGSIKDLVIDNNGDILISGWFGRFFKIIDNSGIKRDLPSYNFGNTSGLIMKIDRNGIYKWHLSLGNSLCDHIGIDDEQNFYVGGMYSFNNITIYNGNSTVSPSMSNSNPSRTPYVLKFDQNANLVWANNLSFTGNNYYVELHDMEVNGRGDVFLAGEHGKEIVASTQIGSPITIVRPNLHYGTSGSNGYLIKYNRNGKADWAHSLGTSSSAFNYRFDEARSVAVHNNAVYLGVTTDGASNTSFHIPSTTGPTQISNQGFHLLVKYDFEGRYIWDRGLRINTNSIAANPRNEAVFVDKLGYVYTQGYVFHPNSNGGPVDIATDGSNRFSNKITVNTQQVSALFMKYTSNGDLVYASTESGTTAVPGLFDIYPNDICVDDDGFFYSTGQISSGTSAIQVSSDTFSTDSRDAYIAKFTANFNTQDDRIIIDPNRYAFCQGSSVTIPFTVSGTILSNNVYSLEMTNAAGQFTNPPMVIATKNSSNHRDSITFAIPSFMQPNRNFRIRINASSPAITGNDIPIFYEVNSTPPPPLSQTLNYCGGETILLSGRFNHNYYWSPQISNQDPTFRYLWVTADTNKTFTVRNSSLCYSVTDSFHLERTKIDSSVFMNNNILSTNESNYLHRWLDCQNGYTSIPNAVSPFFIPSQNGSYAAEITKNGCKDTTTCYTILSVGLAEKNSISQLKVGPNPFQNYIQVSSELSRLELRSINGKLLCHIEDIQNMKWILPQGLAAGTYILYAYSKDWQEVKQFKLIKHE